MTRRTWALAVAAGAPLMALLLGQLMLRPLNHDEHPYVAVARLLADGRLYADFGYNHMPYLPYVFRWAWLVAPEAPALLLGRLLTFAFVAVAGGALAYLAGKLGRHWGLGVVALAAYAGNSLIVASDTIPIKDFAAMAASLAAAAIVVEALGHATPPRSRLVAAGAAAGAAIGFKLPYLVFVLPLALALALAPPSPDRPSRAARLAPFAGGVVLGVLPLIAWIAAYPDVFWFCNVEYHRLYSENFHRAGVARNGVPGIGAKAAYVFWLVARDFSLTGLGATLVLTAVAWLAQREATSARPGWSPEAALVLGSLGLATVVALAPAPSWPHHFAVVVPWGLIAIAWVQGMLTGPFRAIGHGALACLVLMAALQNGRAGAWALASLRAPDRWTPVAVARAGQAIRQAIPATSGPGRIATLAPIFALEAGRPIYPELATGPFFFAVGGLVAPARRTRLHLVSPDSLDALLEHEPPAAILTGRERRTPEGFNLDAPFEAFARRHGYREIPLGEHKLSLYVRPPGDAPRR